MRRRRARCPGVERPGQDLRHQLADLGIGTGLGPQSGKRVVAMTVPPWS